MGLSVMKRGCGETPGLNLNKMYLLMLTQGFVRNCLKMGRMGLRQGFARNLNLHQKLKKVKKLQLSLRLGILNQLISPLINREVVITLQDLMKTIGNSVYEDSCCQSLQLRGQSLTP